MRGLRPLLLLALLAPAGCLGTYGPAGGGGDDDDAAGRIDPPLCSGAPGPAPLRRMTRFEYNNTIRDLLGDASAPADAFPPEEETLGFQNNASGQSVTPLLAEHYMTAAEAVARRATEDLSRLLPCDPAALGDQACARELIVTLGRRAFRRPLEADEVGRLEELFTTGSADGGLRGGVERVLQALLQSPHFLYRVELGVAQAADGAGLPLSSWEVASRLSYLLWGSMPDEELFRAAEAGELATREQLAAQARRMLGDPRARRVVRDFHAQWLLLDQVAAVEKDPAVFPTFYPSLAPLLREETEAFVEHVVFDEGGDVRQLFVAPYTFLDAELAAYYGLSGPAGDRFEKVALDGTGRAGLLTQAGLLAALASTNQTSPVHRGKFVREQLLCQALPTPPDALEAPAPDPNATTRERFAQHSADPACSGCHALMDPIGFGFESFDGAGLLRATEGGRPVDASGALTNSDVDGPFVGPIELGQKLAQSQQVRDCVVTQWFRYAHGRAETAEDQCAVEGLRARFAEAGYDVRELLVALTQTDAFRYLPAAAAPAAEGASP